MKKNTQRLFIVDTHWYYIFYKEKMFSLQGHAQPSFLTFFVKSTKILN